jgi:hypothetical protein
MRFPRPRFTVRWMMAVVAIVGIVVGCGIECERRRLRFHKLCALYQAKILEHSTPSYFGPVDDHRHALYKAFSAKNAKSLAYYMKMANKYYLAELRPWLPVAPDPPEPQPPINRPPLDPRP